MILTMTQRYRPWQNECVSEILKQNLDDQYSRLCSYCRLLEDWCPSSEFQNCAARLSEPTGSRSATIQLTREC